MYDLRKASLYKGDSRDQNLWNTSFIVQIAKILRWLVTNHFKLQLDGKAFYFKAEYKFRY